MNLIELKVELHRTNELLAEIASALNRLAPLPLPPPDKTPPARVVRHKTDKYFADLEREGRRKAGLE